VVHDGYTSVYTVDASDSHLQETYLPAMGDPWTTQDLSAEFGTPPTNVTPAAVVHSGFTSVFTVDASNSDLQETYLPAIGDPWSTQDLSANYGTPPVVSGASPAAVYHTGYTSVYTVDQSDNDLQETYLPAMGDPWSTQDLSGKYGIPHVIYQQEQQPQQQQPEQQQPEQQQLPQQQQQEQEQQDETPVALLHPDASGGLTWTSVFTRDSNDDLQETYLPAMGDPWSTQDLSANYGTPPVQ
jgi:hypothetical protein